MSTMTNLQRHTEILKQLEEKESIDVLQLCEELNVSAVTIRKDLRLLEEKGLLYRTHGGASRYTPYIRERPVMEKEQLSAAEKKRIAAAAAKLVVPNDSIILASGTTIHAMAREMVPQTGLTVITSSLNVALTLLPHQEINVLQLCGPVRHSSGSVTGQVAEAFLDHVVCSKLFLGVDGIDLIHGLTTTDLAEARLNKKMIDASESTIVLADSSKFSRHGFGKICGFEAITRVITDDKIPEKIVKQLENMGVIMEIV